MAEWHTTLIIQRYIIKEILYNWAAVTLILSLIYAVGLSARFLSSSADGSLQIGTVFVLLGLKYFNSMSILYPLTLYLAIIVGLGRMYKDNEMTAIAACGFGVISILSVAVKISIFACLALLAVSLYASPWAEHKIVKMLASSRADTNLSIVASGRFTEIKSANLVFYTQQISSSGKELENLFVQRTHNGQSQLLTAKTAHLRFDEKTGDSYLVFVNGYSYDGIPGEADYKIVRFKNYGIRIPSPKTNLQLKNLRQSARPTNQIWNSDDMADRAEFQWRFALPLSTILLSMLAVLLSHTSPRQDRFSKLFVALLIYLTYNNLLGMANTWYEKGVTPSFLGLWWVNFLLFVLIIILLVKQMGTSWVISNLQAKFSR